MKTVSDILQTVDEVIARGPYKDSWDSLSRYETPGWYRSAKFGIFIHWGVYSVPAFGNEWYPRNMYIKGHRDYKHHVATYGEPKDFPYEKFIPMFKAERFDAGEWMRLFAEAGAKYVVPVAEHHDGFQMYDSELSDWCAAKMGPRRDVLGELKAAAEREGIVLGASSHRAENCWFFNGANDFDSGISGAGLKEPYGYRFPGEDNIDGMDPVLLREHLDMWLARTCEIVDKYRPKIIYFDWWIENRPFKPYLKKFAAYYYNRALEWGEQVAINYKNDAYAPGTAVFDLERGQMSGIGPRFWQTDTSLSKWSWGYIQKNYYKTPLDIVCNLVDIVSKNGTLLLNVGPKPDGTIPEEEKAILKAIGAWMAVNGEAVYGSACWRVFGEGPTKVGGGQFTDTVRGAFTARDIRFTYKAPYIYAFVLACPRDGQVRIRSLGRGTFRGFPLTAELLGTPGQLPMKQNKRSLDIKLPEGTRSEYPIVLKIRFD